MVEVIIFDLSQFTSDLAYFSGVVYEIGAKCKDLSG